MPPSTEIQLMRIIQEALSNVRKHADAKSVRIDFQAKSRDLEIVISDDGKGFDPARIRSAGWPRFGLQTMRERAESVDGTFVVDASPRMGTKVVVSVPFAALGEERVLP